MKESSESNHPASMEEAMRNRMFAAIRVLGNEPAFGSLWWVSETVWQEHILGYGKHSTRKGHPGLSILKGRLASPYEAVPMLHGTSKEKSKNRLVQVKELTSEAEDRVTFFGRIRPAMLGLDLFLNKIKRNTHKRSITEAERHQLEEWLEQKELS